jgi:hypothetical protein
VESQEPRPGQSSHGSKHVYSQKELTMRAQDD